MDQINDYIQTSLGSVTSDITDMLFQWLVIPSLIFMVVIVAIYSMRAARRHRVENAIFEIRDLLKNTDTTKHYSSHPPADSDTPQDS